APCARARRAWRGVKVALVTMGSARSPRGARDSPPCPSRRRWQPRSEQSPTPLRSLSLLPSSRDAGDRDDRLRPALGAAPQRNRRRAPEPSSTHRTYPCRRATRSSAWAGSWRSRGAAVDEAWFHVGPDAVVELLIREALRPCPMQG